MSSSGYWKVVVPPSEAVPSQKDGEEKKALLAAARVQFAKENGADADTWKKLQQSKKCNWINAAVIVCLWMAYTVCNVAYSMMAPFFPQIAEKRGASPLLIGLIFGSAPLSVFLTSPLFGYMLPRFKMWCQVFLALVLVGASYLALGFATKVSSEWGFITACVALRICEGIGTAILTTATFSTFPSLYPNSVGALVGLFEIGAAIGYMSGPWLGGALFQYGGYQLPFFSVGGSILFYAMPSTLLLLVFKKMSFAHERKTLPLHVIYRVFTDLPFLIVVLILATLYYPVSFLAPALPQFLDREYHQSVLEVGSLYFINASSYGIGALLIGLVTDKLGHKKCTCLFGMVVMIFGYLIFGVPYYLGVRNIWLIRFSAFLRSFGVAFYIIPVYGLLLGIGKRYTDDNIAGLSSFISGLIAAAGNFNLFLGPMVGGITAIVPVPMCTILLAEAILAELCSCVSSPSTVRLPKQGLDWKPSASQLSTRKLSSGSTAATNSTTPLPVGKKFLAPHTNALLRVRESPSIHTFN